MQFLERPIINLRDRLRAVWLGGLEFFDPKQYEQACQRSLDFINNAKKQIEIVTDPDEISDPKLEALLQAAQRGVRVGIITGPAATEQDSIVLARLQELTGDNFTLYPPLRRRPNVHFMVADNNAATEQIHLPGEPPEIIFKPDTFYMAEKLHRDFCALVYSTRS